MNSAERRVQRRHVAPHERAYFFVRLIFKETKMYEPSAVFGEGMYASFQYLSANLVILLAKGIQPGTDRIEHLTVQKPGLFALFPEVFQCYATSHTSCPLGKRFGAIIALPASHDLDRDILKHVLRQNGIPNNGKHICLQHRTVGQDAFERLLMVAALAHRRRPGKRQR